MIYEIMVLLTSFVTSPYISRVIGAEGLGTYSYSYSVAYCFVLFSMLGIANYGNRAIAGVRDDQSSLNDTFSAILVLHIGISLICCTAYLGYVVLVRQDRIYAAIQGLYVLSGLFDISWFYFGIERFKLTASCSMAVRLVNVCCIFLFVRTQEDLWKYTLIMAGCNLINQLILWLPLRRYVHFVKPEWGGIRPHIVPMFILFIPAIAVNLYKYMDKIMIGILSSKEQLAFYENAEKFTNVPLTLINAFSTVMMPKMSNLVANGKTAASRRYIAMSMQYNMFFAIAMFFGVAAIANTFAPVFWGTEFAGSGDIIMGLSVTIPFISFANLLRTLYLIPNKRDREYLISVGCGAVSNLTLNAFLIPSMGAMGATAGTVATEMIVCLIQAFFVRRELPIVEYVKNFLPFILPGAVMFAAVNMMGRYMEAKIGTLVLQIAVGVLIYGIAGLFLSGKKRNAE